MDDSTRIVLLGKTGSGKSSLANTIFGEKVFTVNHTSKSGTRECKAETRSVHGRRITLIDTPGFFDTDMSEEDLRAAIVKCIVECAPGPHAFLILLKVEKFSEHEENIIKKAEEYFTEDVCKYATVVFTHGDQLHEGQTIEDFLSEDQSLMEKFGGHCHVIDNKYWNKENPEDEYRSNKFQVEQLLKSVDEIMKINKGCFTNEMLQTVSEEIQEEKECIRSSSENMSEEEIEERAKQKVGGRLLINLAGISTGVLLGALMGVVVMGITVLSFVHCAKQIKTIVKVLKGGAAAGGAATGEAAIGGAAAGAAKVAVGAVAVSAAVGGVAGGLAGYYAAVDAETPLEAMKKAANAVFDGANFVSDQIQKFQKRF